MIPGIFWLWVLVPLLSGKRETSPFPSTWPHPLFISVNLLNWRGNKERKLNYAQYLSGTRWLTERTWRPRPVSFQLFRNASLVWRVMEIMFARPRQTTFFACLKGVKRWLSGLFFLAMPSSVLACLRLIPPRPDRPADLKFAKATPWRVVWKTVVGLFCVRHARLMWRYSTKEDNALPCHCWERKTSLLWWEVTVKAVRFPV